LSYARLLLVLQRHRVHRFSGPTFVTIAKRPSCGPGWLGVNQKFP